MLAPPDTPLLDAARAAVAHALPEPPSAAALAAALGMHRATLHRALHAHGTTPSALIRSVRLGHAADRLADGASVTEAAEAAGYHDLPAFSRTFRAHHGVPPSRWAGHSSQDGPDLRPGAKHDKGSEF